MQKKHQRAVNITQGVSAWVGVTGLRMGATGLPTMATGIWVITGIVFFAIGTEVFIVVLACGVVTRKCTAKATKHAAVEMVARTKLNSVHQMISKALIDGKVLDEEFKLTTDEVDRYHAMKEDIRVKAHKLPEGETIKKEWIERGREEVRAEFARYMTIFGVPQN